MLAPEFSRGLPEICCALTTVQWSLVVCRMSGQQSPLLKPSSIVVRFELYITSLNYLMKIKFREFNYIN